MRGGEEYGYGAFRLDGCVPIGRKFFNKRELRIRLEGQHLGRPAGNLNIFRLCE